MIEVVIFDWGRTLYDSDNGVMFPETGRVVRCLARRYRLAIVSLVTASGYQVRVTERLTVLRDEGLAPYFSAVLFALADKDQLYERALARLRVAPEAVAVVDDRACRGIAWGARRGATTIWLCHGKFKDERPNEQTGWPTHIIDTLAALPPLLLSETELSD